MSNLVIKVVGPVRAGRLLHIFYLWAVVVAGAVLLARHFPHVDLDYSVELGVLILVAMAAEWLVVCFPHGQLSSGYAVTFGTLLLFGPAAAAWVTALGTLFGQGIANRGNPLRTTLFNAAQSVLAVTGAYWVYEWCGGTPHPGELVTLANVPPLLAFSAACFLLNHLQVYLYTLPRHRMGPVGWRHALAWDASTYLFLVPLGFLVAVIYEAAGLTGAFLVLLLGLVTQFFMRRYVRVELNNRELNVLYEVARRLGGNSDPDGLPGLILQETRHIVPYHTAVIYLWSEERRLFIPAEVHSPFAAELQDIVYDRDEGIVGWAAETREPCLIVDARKDPLLRGQPGFAQFLRSLLVIPLVHRDEVLGVFMIGERRPEAYDEQNLHILTIVGGQLAVAVDNARLHRRLQQAGGRDPLTGLADRYHFLRHLEAELTRTRNQDLPLAVVLFDVERLQILNERYGYSVGDRALIQVGRLLADKAPPTAMVARYGSDEFGVLLPDSGEIRAAETAERLQRAVEQISFGVEGGTDRLRLAVRFGLAVSPLDGATADELLGKAERDLRRAAEPVRPGTAAWDAGGGVGGV